MAAFFPCLHIIFPPCVCALVSSSYKDTSHIGSGPTHMTQFYLNLLFKGLMSKYSLRCWGLGLQHKNFGKTQFISYQPDHPLLLNCQWFPLTLSIKAEVPRVTYKLDGIWPQDGSSLVSHCFPLAHTIPTSLSPCCSHNMQAHPTSRFLHGCSSAQISLSTDTHKVFTLFPPGLYKCQFIKVKPSLTTLYILGNNSNVPCPFPDLFFSIAPTTIQQYLYLLTWLSSLSSTQIQVSSGTISAQFFDHCTPSS